MSDSKHTAEPNSGERTEAEGTQAAQDDVTEQTRQGRADSGQAGNVEANAENEMAENASRGADTVAEPLEAEVEVEETAPPEGAADPASDLMVQDLKNQLARTLADFDNFRRRTRQEKEDLQKYANRKLLADLLPVVDNFERALQSFDNETSAQSADIKKGIDMVHRQFLSVLQAAGVEAMNAVGKPFDPNVHEAVMQEPSNDQEAGTVLEEFQKGYMLEGRVLRPAMVKVSV